MSQKDLVAPELFLTDNLRRKAAAFLTFKSTVAVEVVFVLSAGPHCDSPSNVPAEPLPENPGVRHADLFSLL